MTWAIARSTTHSDVRFLRKQIAACEKRAATRLTESIRATNAALVAKKEVNRLRELKSKNEQLQQAKKKEQELASAEAGESRGGNVLPPGQKSSTSPMQSFELSAGEQRDIIPGVLNLRVETLDPASAEVWYGSYPRHLKVGQSVAISYLGRPCMLGLTEIKGAGDTYKAFFSFSVVNPTRWNDEPAAPASGPSE
jgi:hypothetical protein